MDIFVEPASMIALDNQGQQVIERNQPVEPLQTVRSALLYHKQLMSVLLQHTAPARNAERAVFSVIIDIILTT